MPRKESAKAARAAENRQKLLDTGLVMLRDEPAGRLFERLQAPAICAHAGVSTGSFYDHFDSPDGFVASLLEYALTYAPNRPLEQLRTVFEEQLAAGASFLETLVATGAGVMAWQRTNLTFMLEMAVWAKCHRNPKLTDVLDRMYRVAEEETTSYYQAVLTLLGREMRPPFTLNDLAGSIIAVYEGLSLRQAISPQVLPPNRLGSLLAPIIMLMTRPEGDSEDAGAWLEANTPRWATAGPAIEAGIA